MSHQTSSPVDTPDEIRSKFLTFLNDWKGRLAGLVFVVGVGWGLHAYSSSLATRTDLAGERARSSGQVESFGLRVDSVVRRLDVLDEGNKWRDATLAAIAAKLGVYTPPPPSLTAP